MKMKKIALMCMVSSILFACTSNSSTETSEASKAPVSEEPAISGKEKVPTIPVLNPNLASASDMGNIGLSAAEIEALTAGRPYLDPLAFLAELKAVAGEGKFDELKAKIFLPMNLNTTAEEAFKMVPKVGDKMAHEFEEYRPYASVAQFRREIGKYVSEEEVAAYEHYVFVPVNLNTAGKEEILAIPGVGEKMAHEFEEYRPYHNIERFRREIGKYVDDDELARLERYVTLK